MGFSCSCDDSDWGLVTSYDSVWAGDKTLLCKECKCELAPGHAVHTEIYTD